MTKSTSQLTTPSWVVTLPESTSRTRESQMKRLALLSLLILGLLAPASAQVNVVPQTGVTTGYLAKQTYSSAFFGLVPVTAGTDVVCISGSASKVVRLQRLTIYGTVATAAL